MSYTFSNEELRNDFKKIFGVEVEHTFFSPGRINLIGEHTDYNGVPNVVHLIEFLIR